MIVLALVTLVLTLLPGLLILCLATHTRQERLALQSARVHRFQGVVVGKHTEAVGKRGTAFFMVVEDSVGQRHELRMERPEFVAIDQNDQGLVEIQGGVLVRFGRVRGTRLAKLQPASWLTISCGTLFLGGLLGTPFLMILLAMVALSPSGL